jgi:hypothetical protein
MDRRWGRRTVVAGVALAALAACGGGKLGGSSATTAGGRDGSSAPTAGGPGPSTTASGSATTAPSSDSASGTTAPSSGSATTATTAGGEQAAAIDAALHSLPATAEAKKHVTTSDVGGLRQAAGLPVVVTDVDPTWTKVSLSLGDGGHALRLLAQRNLLLDSGFDPFAVTSEVSAGQPPGMITVATVDFDGTRFGAALVEAGFTKSTAGGLEAYTTSRPALKGIGRALVGVQVVVFAEDHQRIGFSGSDDNALAVADAVKGEGVQGSLADDPQVQAVLDAIGPHHLAGAGTDYISAPDPTNGGKAPTDQAKAVIQEYGLADWPAPTFAGYGFQSDGAGTGLWTAVATYADDAAAASAAEHIRKVLSEGKSMATAQPYAELLQVDDVTASGPAVVAHLRLTNGRPLTQLMFRRDLPVFWAPIR